MAKMLVKATYKTKGTKGLIKEGGTARRAAVKSLVESMGGKLEAFYFAYGEADAVLIIDVPDSTSGLALTLAVNASGAVHLASIPLITPEEVDAAAKRVPAYRAPGEGKPAGKAPGRKR